jgi:hypothetical protein
MTSLSTTLDSLLRDSELPKILKEVLVLSREASIIMRRLQTFLVLAKTAWEDEQLQSLLQALHQESSSVVRMLEQPSLSADEADSLYLAIHDFDEKFLAVAHYANTVSSQPPYFVDNYLRIRALSGLTQLNENLDGKFTQIIHSLQFLTAGLYFAQCASNPATQQPIEACLTSIHRLINSIHMTQNSSTPSNLAHFARLIQITHVTQRQLTQLSSFLSKHRD